MTQQAQPHNHFCNRAYSIRYDGAYIHTFAHEVQRGEGGAGVGWAGLGWGMGGWGWGRAGVGGGWVGLGWGGVGSWWHPIRYHTDAPNALSVTSVLSSH